MILRNFTKRMGGLAPVYHNLKLQNNITGNGQISMLSQHQSMRQFSTGNNNNQESDGTEKQKSILFGKKPSHQQQQQRQPNQAAQGQQQDQTKQRINEYKKEKAWTKQYHERPPQQQRQQAAQQQQQNQDKTATSEQQPKQEQQQRQQEPRDSRQYTKTKHHEPNFRQNRGTFQGMSVEEMYRQAQTEQQTFINENEHLERPGEAFIQKKVGEFRVGRRHKISAHKYIDEILEGDINQEIRYQSTQSAAAPQNPDLQQALQSLLKAQLPTGQASVVGTRRQDAQKYDTLRREEEVKLAIRDLERLKSKFPLGDNQQLNSITEDMLRKSEDLRKTVREYHGLYYYLYENKSSFEKPQKEFHSRSLFQEQVTDQTEAWDNSLLKLEKLKYDDVLDHNQQAVKEYYKGEEGVDYVAQTKEEKENDPTKPNEKMLLKQLKNQLKMLKSTDPEKAQQFQEEVIDRNDYDEIMSREFDFSEIKFYPGSEKGPKPEDDPRAYSRWFAENQPKKAFEGYLEDGKHTFEEFGMKVKNKNIIKEENNNVEILSKNKALISDDNDSPTHNFEGIVEWALLDQDTYQVEEDFELPSIVLQTDLAPNELPIIPNDHTYIYQDVHYELERYTIFRSLPSMMQFNDKHNELLLGFATGRIKAPNFMETINPPSLWAYFLTLPQWARHHPIVRDVLMAMEYHKPDLDIRQKELALNYAVSFIRPIDKTLENVIIDIASSNKIRLNAQLGKEAINTLKFYDFDPELLGTTSESEELPEMDEEDQQQLRNQRSNTFNYGADDDEDNQRRVVSAMERFASGQEEDERDKQLMEAMKEEKTVENVQGDSEADAVLTDFYVKPYKNLYDVEEAADPIIPLFYFDNEDGFWNGHIQRKFNKWQEHDMIVNRKFIKV
eukprot:403330831